MKQKLLEILHNEDGQVLPWMALLITLILGAAGLTIDLGHAYVCYRQLQSSTDAAALAGAYAMAQSGATQTGVKAEVSSFSSVTGGANSTQNLPAAAVQTSFKCVTGNAMVSVGCVAFNTSTTNVPNGYNVIQVTQQSTVPTYFIGALTQWGKNPETRLTLNAVATAAMQSGPPEQVNVALVVDTTASMASKDTDPLCGQTRIYCALAGVQTLLQGLTPCAAGFTGTKCTPFDRVSLFTFPAIEASQVSYDTNCKGNNPQIESYTTPAQGAAWSSLTGATTTYQITDYSANYSSTNGKGGALPSTSSSTIVAATSNSGKCGMNTPGGAGTYYAGVIYAAQSSLIAQSTANPGTQNIMIILSDGDASSGNGGNSCSLPGGSCILDSSGKPATNNGATYPSLQDQCAQAVAAAQYATGQGTTVYTIAYGSPGSGCSTDAYNKKTNTAGTNITPCQAMQQMSSGWPTDITHFYSDSTAAGGGSCVSVNGGSLDTIFGDLAAAFSRARLVPNNIS
jgi:Putative Flp pilus-assembly TadE/G-like